MTKHFHPCLINTVRVERYGFEIMYHRRDLTVTAVQGDVMSECLKGGIVEQRLTLIEQHGVWSSAQCTSFSR